MEKDPLEKEGIQDVTVVNPQENEIIKAIYGSGELVDYVILKFQIRDGKIGHNTNKETKHVLRLEDTIPTKKPNMF